MSPLMVFRHSKLSVYFFIANTNKVDSSKMIEMRFKTFIIKVLVFIYIYLLSFRLEADTLLNVPKEILYQTTLFILLRFNRQIMQRKRWTYPS